MPESEIPPILVADADEGLRALAVSLLARLGFPEVAGVGDAAAALERLRARRHALLLADLGPEPVDGIALCREIRADAGAAGLPVILAAEAFDFPAIAGARLSGADAFILKPFDLETLRAKVRHVLNRRPGRRAVEAPPPSAFALDFPLLAQG